MTTSTEAAALLEDLPRLAAERRTLLNLTLREASAQIGIGFNTLSRLERAIGTLSLANATAVLRWLDVPTAPVQPATAPTGELDALRERIAGALTTAAHRCTDAYECDQPTTICTHPLDDTLTGRPEALAAAVMDVIRPVLERLGERIEDAETDAQTQRLRVIDHKTVLKQATQRAVRYRTAWWSARIRAANMAAIMERFPDVHMRFRVLGEPGDLPCADWCYACKLDAATKRAEQAEREAREYRTANTTLQELNVIRTERAEKAEAALERVRALHRNEYGCCAECTEVHSVLWPCNTIRALELTAPEGTAL
jgi:transcriptional regulator with XRE-family HTH domain